MTPDALTFAELLAYTDQETARWHAWLREQDPAALDLVVGEGRRATVRHLIHHVFAVERRYVDRVRGELPVAFEAVPMEPLDTLFEVHHEARVLLRGWMERASPDDWNRVLVFDTLSAGTQRATVRKVVAHALLHGIRHWAQIATALRAAGYPQPWGHDLLLSTTLE
jgi:uncharacterized damage-inducible protein DinB